MNKQFGVGQKWKSWAIQMLLAYFCFNNKKLSLIVAQQTPIFILSTSKNNSYCSVNQFSKYNPEKKKTDVEYIDKCFQFQNESDEDVVDNEKDTILNIITPYMDN